MLRMGRAIRLTRPEADRFTRISGVVPKGVKTIDDLDEYVRECKRKFWGVSEETKFLHQLLDRERLRCLAAA